MTNLKVDRVKGYQFYFKENLKIHDFLHRKRCNVDICFKRNNFTNVPKVSLPSSGNTVPLSYFFLNIVKIVKVVFSNPCNLNNISLTIRDETMNVKIS